MIIKRIKIRRLMNIWLVDIVTSNDLYLFEFLCLPRLLFWGVSCECIEDCMFLCFFFFFHRSLTFDYYFKDRRKRKGKERTQTRFLTFSFLYQSNTCHIHIKSSLHIYFKPVPWIYCTHPEWNRRHENSNYFYSNSMCVFCFKSMNRNK